LTTAQEIFRRHLDQRDTLHVPARNEVEGHVDASRLRNHIPGVLVYGPLVEGVEDGHLGRAARAPDISGYRLERLAGTAGEEDAYALAGELPGDRAANGPASAVDDRVPVL
jgi:hypothetical protein